jgi:hypothetical protein
MIYPPDGWFTTIVANIDKAATLAILTLLAKQIITVFWNR